MGDQENAGGGKMTTGEAAAAATAVATPSPPKSKSLSVAFVHPDLGIGGAERLVVDAAVGLQARGHRVVVYTSHHDPKHCFQETQDGTLIIRVGGNTLVPVSLFGAFYIVCSILRSLQLAMNLLFSPDTYDVIFVDQQSASIPLLRLSKAKIFFYCHFPDKLLTRRDSFLKRIYRWPVDRLEELTTGMADMIAVNSRFTAKVYKEAFSLLPGTPYVLYPGIKLDAYDKPVKEYHEDVIPLKTSRRVILSINRFERKKNVDLAITAFARLKSMMTQNGNPKLRLVVAGGYDKRVIENVQYHNELDALARARCLSTFTIWRRTTDGDNAPLTVPDDTDVVFLPSFSEEQRTYLLHRASLLIYTPSNEHFGIVPVEAMYAGIPVVAANSGGPTETIAHGQTGYLVEPGDVDFAAAATRILEDGDEWMGRESRRHVQERFSLERFTRELDALLVGLVDGKIPSTATTRVPAIIALLMACAAGFVIFLFS